MRLIDADVLTDKVDDSKHNNPHPAGMIRVNHRNEHNHFIKMIFDAPTVDAVEVVRCKDCFADGGCSVQIDLGMGGEGYCSKGKRRIDNA